jgi:hypothetical protein
MKKQKKKIVSLVICPSSTRYRCLETSVIINSTLWNTDV